MRIVSYLCMMSNMLGGDGWVKKKMLVVTLKQ